MPLHRRKLEDEVVEDSEPERERARQLQRSNATPSQISTRERRQSFEGAIPSSSIIEISDDNVSDSPSNALNPSLYTQRGPEIGNNISVIDISDSSMELPPLTANSPPETTGLTRLLLDLGDYDSELDNTLPELRLARYAHTSTRPVKPSKPKIIPSHTIRAMSTSVGASRSTPAKKAVEQNIVQRLSDEFPTISCLLICVSCDTTWTTRKSVPQKLTHIKSCAKKHGIKDDTLVELVRKGIENALAMQPKGKHIATDEPARKTFFDEVVHDAAPRKRNRRQEVTSTIKDIGETRNTIMRKARMIVSKGNSNVRAFRERGIGDLDSDGDLYTDFLPSSTPRFGESSLARRTGLQARSLFHDDGEDPESLLSFFNAPLLPYIPSIREPPSMPSIPSSSGLGNEVPQVLMDIDVHNLETPPKNKTAPFFNASSSPPPFNISTSSNQTTPNTLRNPRTPNLPPLTPSPRKLTSLTSSLSHPTSSSEHWPYHSDDELKNYADDAYLHFDQDNKSHGPSTPNQSPLRATPQSLPVRLTKKTKSRSRSPTAPRRRKKTHVKENLIVDDRWAENLRDKIMEDTTLHLRILRFEPIHFDVFLSKVDRQSSAKMKYHLREFLDKQAINFYGAEPVGRRRR